MIEDYVRNAVLVKVVDGDTLDLDIDLGFRIWARRRVRLLGVNCPEMHGASTSEGQRAKDYTATWMYACGGKVQIKTHLDPSDSFGRLLAEVMDGDRSLENDLLSSGNAVIYAGGTDE